MESKSFSIVSDVHSCLTMENVRVTIWQSPHTLPILPSLGEFGLFHTHLSLLVRVLGGYFVATFCLANPVIRL